MYDDEDKYWDRRGAESSWYNKVREDEEKKRIEKEKIRRERIDAKGEYVVPDEFNTEFYDDFRDKIKADDTKKKYEDYDAYKLYNYVMTLRHYYADAIYNFYKRFDPEKLKSLSAFILGEIPGNKLEFDDIKYNKELAINNEKMFLINEKRLVKQRKEFYVFQTHHERTVQGLFNKKSYFQVLQQRGLEAKLMKEMYNQGFFIDLGIKPTNQIKKMYKESDDVLNDFYLFPIVKEILQEKESKIKNLLDRKIFLKKCRYVKNALLKLKPLLSVKNTTLENFALYKDSKYVKIMKAVIVDSINKVDEVINQAELTEIHDYYNGVDVFKKD